MSKNMNRMLLAAFVLVSIEATAEVNQRVEPVVSLGAPVYSGTGCPIATISSAVSTDGAALSMLFDNFVVDADSNSRAVRKNCNIEIPVQVPSGIRASLVGIDYRGFNNLPPGATADLSAEYMFTGGVAMLFSKTFYGPLLENYLLKNTLSTARQTWSSCGGTTVLRGNKALLVTTNSAGDQASSTIDSIDIVTNAAVGPTDMTFYFQWQPCTTNQTAQPSAASSLKPSLLGLTSIVSLVAYLIVG